MTIILDTVIASTLDDLVRSSEPGTTIEAWTFDDGRRRRDAEERLRAKGVTSKIRSAYKPLLYAFIEDIDLEGVEEIEIRYPVHENAPANRFRLEAYPLAALLEKFKLTFVERQDGAFYYDVDLIRHGQWERIRVLAPNRVHVDAVGQINVSPTGWIRSDLSGGKRLETDYEKTFDAIIRAVSEYDWGPSEPFFEELNISVRHHARDEPIPVGQEVVSLREALHEDLYFTLLEIFQKRTGRNLGDRDLRPGQIVPEIMLGEVDTTIRVELRPLCRKSTLSTPPDRGAAQQPFTARRVDELLLEIGGRQFSSKTRSRRRVHAVYVSGSDRPVMISGGQHPNEVTGIGGAILAGQVLAKQSGAHFFLSPLENPDGLALHERLRADNPSHMHHAARYTAYGDDFEWRGRGLKTNDLGEKEMRHVARRESKAGLHVNLHGYPSHEWTRPLTGYVPRNFSMWSLPKGFFLIVRYYTGWQAIAEEFLERLTRELSESPVLAELNRVQIATYRTHAGELPFGLSHGFPFICVCDDGLEAPITLITEYPDETIYGEDFVKGCNAQREAVLVAYRIWQALASGWR